MTIRNAIALALALGGAAAFVPSATALQNVETRSLFFFNHAFLTLIETPCSASVSITGGSINYNESMYTLGFGQWWRVEVSGGADDSQDDEIYFTLSLQHISECDDLHPLGMRWISTWTILAEQYNDGSCALNGPEGTRDHGDHMDRFYNHSLQFSKSTDNFPTLDQDEIDSWSYTLQAEHVPAPGVLAPLGFVVGAMLRRRGRYIAE